MGLGKFLLSILFLFLVFSFSSCKRAELENDLTSSKDHVLVQGFWDDVNWLSIGSSSIAELDSLSDISWSNCGSLKADTSLNVFPNTITLDFGEDNCAGIDGRTRQGKVIYTITDPYWITGSIITATPDNYRINGYRLEGVIQSMNTGEDVNGAIEFDVTVSEAVITTPENEMITWESTRKLKWIEGQNTSYFTYDSVNNGFLQLAGIMDDVFSINATASGTDRNGRAFEMKTTEDIRIRVDCSNIVSGIVELKPEDLEKRVIDYGTGSCDNQVTVLIDDKIHTVYIEG